MKVTTTDGMLQVYRDRDLSSSIVATLPRGVDIQLGDKTLYEGREWMEATLEDGSVGHVLAPSARSHTTFDPIPAVEVPVSKENEKARTNLRWYGVLWLVLAVLQFALREYGIAKWGFVCAAVGAINLAYPVRQLLIVNGLAMIGVGIGNFLGLYGGDLSFIAFVGITQALWGLRLLAKFLVGDKS
jgi:hypothetical protein